MNLLTVQINGFTKNTKEMTQRNILDSNSISMSIRIFITGGTFDKEYNEITGQLYFNDTHLHDLLEMGRNKVPLR